MAHNVDMKPFGVLLFIGVLFSIAPPSYSYNSHIGVDLGHGAPENTTYHESESGQKLSLIHI